jgi:hypothetical protein
MQYEVLLSITKSGRIARVSAPNGRIIAEFLVKGFLNKALHNAVSNLPIEKGRVNVFRGELRQLAPYEYLDIKEEDIYDRDELDIVNMQSNGTED